MNEKDKTAIENLIIIGRYMQDNSILGTEAAGLLEKSILRAEDLIGHKVVPHTDSLDLGEVSELNVDSYITALKNKKKS